MRLADYVIKTALSWMTLLVEQMSNTKKANVDPDKGNTKADPDKGSSSTRSRPR